MHAGVFFRLFVKSGRDVFLLFVRNRCEYFPLKKYQRVLGKIPRKFPAKILENLKKVIDEFLKDGIIVDVLKYTHSCICTNTAGGEVR